MPTSSGTYNFAPSIAQITLYAFNMLGMRPTSLLQEHMESARMAANFVLADWSNKGVNLWKVSATTVPFVQGTTTYSVPASLVTILDLYVTVGTGTTATNRYLSPVTRTEYVSYSNPTSQGFPTVYWHNRTLTPTLSFYPTPDGNEVSFTYYAMLQLMDAAITNGQLPDLPYVWLNAFVKALAAELSTSWAPGRSQGLIMLAKEAWQVAAAQNVEQGNFYIAPMTAGYWRA